MKPVSWICPNCSHALVGKEGSLRCDNGHSYDLAREGYVNLLATGRQAAGVHGDSKAMLEARRRFLAVGYYQPLRARLIGIITSSRPRVVADIGCGEGFYIGGLARAKPEIACYGTDISKDAVRLAARSYPEASFAVASTYAPLPLADGSVDVVLDVFAPRNATEFARILSPSGHLIVVIPTDGHLRALRERYGLLAIQQDKAKEVMATFKATFRHVATETLAIELSLKGESIADLVEMTPNAWHIDEARHAALLASPRLGTNAEFAIMVFQRLAP